MSEGNRSRSAVQTLALLSYPPDARLLIVNGDDLGMCHAVNAATFEALERGIVTAASLMIPCPWAYDAIASLGSEMDVGVHLTLTSEWERYGWRPMLDPDRCPSLVDSRGFFYPSEQDVYAHAVPEEVMLEAEAQIQRAMDWGLDPTHLDGHMSTLYGHPALLAGYVELARRHNLPLRMAPRRMYEERGGAAVYDALPLDDVITVDELQFVALHDASALHERLLETLRSLQPGVTELCVHVSMRTPESEAIMTDLEARVEALRLMLDEAVRREIERLGIVLIGWRAMRNALRRAA